MELVLDVLVALLFTLGVYAVLWAAGLALSPAGTSATDLRGIGDSLAGAAETGKVAVVLVACVAGFAVLGWATLVEDADLPSFVPNQEGTIPTYFSSALLLIAGALSVLLGAGGHPEGRWWVIWGMALIVLGVDEVAEVHERFEVRTGLPSPVVLSPLGVVAAIAFLKTFPTMPPGSAARKLYVGGAAAWAAALSKDIIHGVDWKSVIEEVLEMSGSTMFLLAVLLMVRSRSSGAPSGGGP